MKIMNMCSPEVLRKESFFSLLLRCIKCFVDEELHISEWSCCRVQLKTCSSLNLNGWDRLKKRWETKENHLGIYILLFFPSPQTLGSGQGYRHVVHSRGQGGSETREGRKGNIGLCSNPIPPGRAAVAACAAFHNSGGFLDGEGGWTAFLHGRGSIKDAAQHQRPLRA